MNYFVRGIRLRRTDIRMICSITETTPGFCANALMRDDLADFNNTLDHLITFADSACRPGLYLYVLVRAVQFQEDRTYDDSYTLWKNVLGLPVPKPREKGKGRLNLRYIWL